MDLKLFEILKKGIWPETSEVVKPQKHSKLTIFNHELSNSPRNLISLQLIFITKSHTILAFHHASFIARLLKIVENGEREKRFHFANSIK